MNMIDRTILSILFAAVIIRPTDMETYGWIYCILVLVIFFIWEGMIQLCYRFYGKKVLDEG